jgi:site-specific DNA-methyltransferase (adenine-specific)
MDNLISQNIKVDMILCDLPYGTTSCTWDTVIPVEELWQRYRKITKPNAPIVLFGSQPFTSLLINSNITNFKEELCWLKNKAASGMQASQKHIKIHENIIVFAYSSKYTFNPQKWHIEEKAFITQRKTFKDNEYIGNNIYAPTNRTRKPDTGERNPLSVVSCRVPFTPQNSKKYSDEIDLRLHPTQKPMKLCEYLIETYSNENDLVLDSCMGSGTTGAACKIMNRDFIGIEIAKKYYEIAAKRIGSLKITSKKIKD